MRSRLAAVRRYAAVLALSGAGLGVILVACAHPRPAAHVVVDDPPPPPPPPDTAKHVKAKPARHATHEHEHGAHPHPDGGHHHHPHPHPHLDGENGHHHPY